MTRMVILRLTSDQFGHTFFLQAPTASPTAQEERNMIIQEGTTPLIIITEQGYCALMHDLDRYRHRVAKSEVTLAPCQYREIDPSTFGTSGAAAQVHL